MNDSGDLTDPVESAILVVADKREGWITGRPPSPDDQDVNGYVRILDEHGGFEVVNWATVKPGQGWQHTYFYRLSVPLPTQHQQSRSTLDS